ncbi:Na+/H+ antiporter NhaA [Leucobacter sp.]
MRPLSTGARRFLASQSSGAVVLLLATGAALLWANLAHKSYEAFWHTGIGVNAGDARVEMSLQHWVNDGLMALFFFLVSLEVKKDFALGELRNWRHASLPLLAAVLGLVLPALIFALINLGGEHIGAWGVVISTDTAFVLGILAAFGPRVPAQLRVFLLALAVVDDIGALLVIAFVYTESLDPAWAAVALGIGAIVFAAQRRRVWRGGVYIALGLLLWLAVLQSGVHATIAGVVLALLLPVFPPQRESVSRTEELTQRFRRSPNAAKGKAAAEGILSSVSVNDRFQLSLARTVTFAVVPVFALANAGVLITGESLHHAFTSTLTWGIVISLIAGKFLGVMLAPVFARLLRLGELPAALRTRHIASGALLTGIGFTISLFIVDLAIEDPGAQSDARIGVIAGSLLAALLGSGALLLTARYDAARAPVRAELSRPIDPRRDHLLGSPGARYSLVEYGTFGALDDLPAEDVVTQVRDHYEGGLVFVFRHLRPEGDGTPEQTPEALEAVAAQSPALFWTMRSELNRMSEHDPLDDRQILRAAVNVGANLSRLEADLRRNEWRGRVSEDYLDAETLGLTRRPTFFVNGLVYSGPLEASALIAELEATLPGREPSRAARSAPADRAEPQGAEPRGAEPRGSEQSPVEETV